MYLYTKTYYINLGYLAIFFKKDNGSVSRKPIFDDVDFDPRKDVNEDLYYSVSLSDMFTAGSGLSDDSGGAFFQLNRKSFRLSGKKYTIYRMER